MYNFVRSMARFQGRVRVIWSSKRCRGNTNALATASITIALIVSVGAHAEGLPAGVFNFSAAEYRATDFESIQWDRSDVPGLFITVTRTLGSAGRVLIDYSTDDNGALAYNPTNGSTRALPGSDYYPVHGTLVFDDYQMSASFIIQPQY